MKKSSFVALVLGTISTVLFSLGMCMALLPEWNAFSTGVVFGVLGLILGLFTIAVFRKMENKPKIVWNRKTIGCTLLGILGTLLLGVGLCMCILWSMMVWGVLVGLLGIVLLLMLIPLIRPLR